MDDGVDHSWHMEGAPYTLYALSSFMAIISFLYYTIFMTVGYSIKSRHSSGYPSYEMENWVVRSPETSFLPLNQAATKLLVTFLSTPFE